DSPFGKRFKRRGCPAPRSLLFRESITQSSAMGGVKPRAFSGKGDDRFQGIVAGIKGADAIPVCNVVQEKRRHRRQVSEGDPLHEISESSLFILRKICCKSSCCAVLIGSRGRLAIP